jgi:hypothetical protein
MRKAGEEEITQAMTMGITFKGAKLRKPVEEKVGGVHFQHSGCKRRLRKRILPARRIITADFSRQMSSRILHRLNNRLCAILKPVRRNRILLSRK